MTIATTLAGQLAQYCASYRTLGLPAALRGEFVEIRTDEDVSVLLLPNTFGPDIVEETTGPVIGPVAPSQWWRFLVVPDCDGIRQLHDHAADSLRATLCHRGAVLLLPTTPDRRRRDGCEWIRPAATDHPVPLLSDLLDAALTTTNRAGRPR